MLLSSDFIFLAAGLWKRWQWWGEFSLGKETLTPNKLLKKMRLLCIRRQNGESFSHIALASQFSSCLAGKQWSQWPYQNLAVVWISRGPWWQKQRSHGGWCRCRSGRMIIFWWLLLLAVGLALYQPSFCSKKHTFLILWLHKNYIICDVLTQELSYAPWIKSMINFVIFFRRFQRGWYFICTCMFYL